MQEGEDFPGINGLDGRTERGLRQGAFPRGEGDGLMIIHRSARKTELDGIILVAATAATSLQQSGRRCAAFNFTPVKIIAQKLNPANSWIDLQGIIDSDLVHGLTGKKLNPVAVNNTDRRT
jgi:hypothetical protein